MAHQVIKAGASPDQGFSALTQANTCTAIIPPEQLERLVLNMPPMTEEQAFWMRSYLRALGRELEHREQKRHDKLVDALISVATAASLAFILYCWLFLGLL